MKFPKLDQNQARRQLELLGYQWNDKIYLRFFYPSDDPRKNSDPGRKSDRLNIEEIEKYQQEGRGVYFVVNGGGHKNDDVQSGRALFIEHDHLAKETQKELWRKLGLPEPTFQNDTGGKSIHNFWVLEPPIPIQEWKRLQRDLLEFTDADRSIKNPARVMRLAGGWHLSINGEGNQVCSQTQIISESGKKYSYEELRAIVPEAVPPKPQIPNQGHLNPQSHDQIQIPVPQPIPLLECCRQEVREWVKTGVHQGERRNDTAINVGLELVAVERHLQQIGQLFTESARQLFSEYCRNSEMSSKEEEERWQWCAAKNPTPSCRSEGVENCIKGWYWREHIKNSEFNQNPQSRTIAPPRSSSKPGDATGSTGQPKTRPQEEVRRRQNQQGRETEVNMRQRLNEILAKDYSPPELTEIFNKLSLETYWSIREIRHLANEIENNLDLEDSRRERLAELQELQHDKNKTLDLNLILPTNYATPMTLMAKWMEAPSAAFLTGLMTIEASCLHPKTRLNVKKCLDFVEPAILYSGIVTESGQRKSPIMNALVDPLKELQEEEKERYDSAQKEYEREHELWLAQKEEMSPFEWKDAEPLPPPAQRHFFLDKTTTECIDRIKSEQPNTATLWLKDELSGLFNGYNAYKKGKGDDKESVLSSWNGRGVKKDLKGGERVFLKHDSMSIFGAIQDVTLQKKMGNFDDEQGEWARFLWCLIPLKPLRLPKDDCEFFLSFLKDLYRKARALPPQTYYFTRDAQELYDEYHWQLELRRTSHPQRGMRAAISKMEGYTARLALVLYLTWCIAENNLKPDLKIPKKFVRIAIILSEFYLSQVKLIHADGAAALGEGGLTPRLNVILGKLEQLGELTARKLQASVNSGKYQQRSSAKISLSWLN